MINKIEGLNDLHNLKVVDLSNNELFRIEGLSDLSNLVDLNLSNNEISSIEITNKKLMYLDLSNNEISEIHGLESLENLISLKLSNNDIAQIKNLDKNQKLQILDLEDNFVRKLENLNCLSELKDLQLSSNQITRIECLDNLKKLENLNLNDNALLKIENLNNQRNLKTLSLDENNIEKIEGLENLENLENLRLITNNIKKLEGFNFLTKLKSLDVWNNNIRKIENLDNLNQLESLDLWGNKISKVENLDNLINLQILDLGNNQISFINGELDQLPNLNRISFYGNSISDIRYLLENFVITLNFYEYEDSFYDGHNGILIGNNPLGEDLEARLKIKDDNLKRNSLIDYYDNIKLGAASFKEAKLMLLGEGGAGKTNFSNFLMGEKFEKNQSATTGIKIEHWKPEIRNVEYRINIWDFGGQWIQQQVHQFFLTSECVYVIILNARNSEQPHKWLDWIKNYGTNSKAIIVVNKMEENPSKYMEENNLKEEYSFIHSFHYISLLLGDEGDEREIRNIKNLTEDIKEQLLWLKNINVLHPTNYHSLKSDLEDNFLLKNHSLQFEEFEEKLIDKHGIKGNSEILLKVLQTMGTLRYFENHGRLILSPEWLSDGVYKIMMSKIANEKFGVLDEVDIITIIEDECSSKYTYKRSEVNFLRQLMQDFELAYIHQNKKYFIPTQFANDIPNNEVIDDLKKSADFEFIFEFDTYFPDILISKLIVYFFDRVVDDVYWKNGILLEKDDDELDSPIIAMIQSSDRERRIKISMVGEDIRNFFKEIRGRILTYLRNTNYKYKEYVFYEDIGALIDYKELLILYKNGIKEKQIIYDEKVFNINVIEALGIINNDKELETLKKEIDELKKERVMKNTTTNINIQGNVENVQTGNGNRQIINKNKIINNLKDLEKTKDDIRLFLDELENLKATGDHQQAINQIFFDLLSELSQIDIEYIEENPQESKTLLQKVYDNGKWINDWKNITILPYEILDKGSKILEAIKPVIKPLLSAF